MGCDVDNSVTQKTTILVVGTEDISRLSGYEKSSKHRKAESLIQKGLSIKLLSEKDFIELCKSEDKDINFNIKNDLKKDKSESSIIIEIDAKELSNSWKKTMNNLTDEQKSNFQNAMKNLQKIIDSLNECKHEDVRIMAKNFKDMLEFVEKYYNQLSIIIYKNNNFNVVFTINNEISQLNDFLYDLMKNKISFGDFYMSLDNSIDSISSDLEEHSVPDSIKEYTNQTLDILNNIKEKMISLIK